MDASQETVDAAEVGLSAGATLPFQFRAGARWTPLVISFPHVGLEWPGSLWPVPLVDFGRNADFEVHALFEGVEAEGVATVTARYSRLVADLNRADDDISRIVVPDHPAPRPRKRPGVAPDEARAIEPDEPHGHRWDRPGRGVVWASAVGPGGRAVPLLDEPLSYARFSRRITRFHRPYHRALAVLLERRRQRFGYAILLDAHSMPGSVGIDLVLGTLDGTSCDERLQKLAVERLSGGSRARRPLLSLRVDDPYRGGEIVRRFGRPQEGLHALQLEVNRRLYMDEQRLELFPKQIDARMGAVHEGDPGALASTADDPNATAPPLGSRLGAQTRTEELAELLRRIHDLVDGLLHHAHTLDHVRPAAE